MLCVRVDAARALRITQRATATTRTDDTHVFFLFVFFSFPHDSIRPPLLIPHFLFSARQPT